MGPQNHSLTLYCAQAQPVLEALRREGFCHSRAEYIQKKYQEIGPIFLTVYRWFVREAAAIIPPPDPDCFPYWAFENRYSVESSGNVELLALEVPADQVILFDLYDWNRILQLRYLGTDEAEGRRFERELRLRGLTPRDVMLTEFYPDLRQAVFDSWKALFRHHEALLRGDHTGVGGVQAALWQIRSEWIALP